MGKKKHVRKPIVLERGLPALFVERLQQIYEAKDVDQIIAALGKGRQTTFRVNTLRSSVAEVKKYLQDTGSIYQQIPGMELAFVLPHTTSREVTEWSIYQDAKIYMQNASSQLPPLVLGVRPGETVLDTTAAPGSKTTQMAALMADESGTVAGKLLANDRIFPRFKRLEANCKMQVGEALVCSSRVLAEFTSSSCFLNLYQLHGEMIGKQLPEQFDKVLIDAPCSSEGQFECNKEKTFRFWSRHKAKEMAQKQKGLLASALHAAKVGGEIVYSTCTHAPEENEAVVSWALKRFAGAVELIEIELPEVLQDTMRPGILEFGAMHFDSEVQKTRRVLPGNGFEGFYVAKFKKVASLLE